MNSSKKLLNKIILKTIRETVCINTYRIIEVENLVKITTLYGLINYMLRENNLLDCVEEKDKFHEIVDYVEMYFKSDNRDIYEQEIEFENDIYNEILELIKEDLEI